MLGNTVANYRYAPVRPLPGAAACRVYLSALALVSACDPRAPAPPPPDAVADAAVAAADTSNFAASGDADVAGDGGCGARRDCPCADDCDDGELCTADRCDGALGLCAHDAVDGGVCGVDDIGTCVAGRCELVAVGVTTGFFRSCAWSATGAAHCWGAGSYGALPHGYNPLQRRQLQRLPIDDVAQVAVGDYNTCVRRGAGDVWCWGGPNAAAKDPAAASVSLPRRVTGVDDAIDIDVGALLACAVTSSHKLRCWGVHDGYAHLGPQIAGLELPVWPVTMPPVQKVAVVQAHACALLVDGRVMCFKDNFNPTKWLDSDGRPKGIARLVPGITGAIDVAVANSGSFALLADGSVMAWGAPIPLWGTLPGAETPYLVTKLPGARGIASREWSLCVRDALDRPHCLGENYWGQLGNGSFAPAKGLQPMRDVGAVASLASGWHAACVVLADTPTGGRVRCTGMASVGAVDGMRPDKPFAVPVLPVADGPDIVAAGDGHVCAVGIDGIVRCWGRVVGASDAASMDRGVASANDSVTALPGLGKVRAVAAW